MQLGCRNCKIVPGPIYAVSRSLPPPNTKAMVVVMSLGHQGSMKVFNDGRSNHWPNCILIESAGSEDASNFVIVPWNDPQWWFRTAGDNNNNKFIRPVTRGMGCCALVNKWGKRSMGSPMLREKTP